MVYVESHAPDITESLPANIGGGVAEIIASYPEGFGWDVAIAGLGFRLRITPNRPYRRYPEPTRKQQFDASDEAGEQSLSSWWTRSQASWHGGAGIRWYEPGAEPETANRFADSCGIDPWTIGELRLLRRMEPLADVSGSNPVFVRSAYKDSAAGFLWSTGGAVAFTAADGTTTNIGSHPDEAAVAPPAVTGTHVWLPGATMLAGFDIAQGTEVESYTSSASQRAWWVKGRLIVAVGSDLYEVPVSLEDQPGTVETEGTKLAVSVPPGWVWTAAAEAPGAILAAGHAGAESGVYRFQVKEGDAGPELTAGELVAPMPPGELITAMGTYLGSFIVLGTTLGARVGAINNQGEVAYGPLLIKTANPVVDVAFRDRFAYVLATAALPDGTSGAARIDLSGETEEGLYPWAWDASTGEASQVTSISFVGVSDRVVIGGVGKAWVQSATALVSEGWVRTGAIRFRTVEPKAFRRFQLTATFDGESEVQVIAEHPDGSDHHIYTFNPRTGWQLEAGIQLPRRPLSEFLRFRLRLQPDADDPSKGPVVTGYQVKALPAPKPVEIVEFPLSVFDTEVDRHGVEWSYDGGAYKRFQMLRLLHENGSPVRVTDLRTGEAFVATIDSVEFVGEASPDKQYANFGGVAIVTMRRT